MAARSPCQHTATQTPAYQPACSSWHQHAPDPAAAAVAEPTGPGGLPGHHARPLHISLLAAAGTSMPPTLLLPLFACLQGPEGSDVAISVVHAGSSSEQQLSLQRRKVASTPVQYSSCGVVSDSVGAGSGGWRAVLCPGHVVHVVLAMSSCCCVAMVQL
jgi:hypothetical protein